MCPVAAAEWASLQEMHFAYTQEAREDSVTSLGLCALLSGEKYWRLWDPDTGELLTRLEAASNVLSVTMNSAMGAC